MRHGTAGEFPIAVGEVIAERYRIERLITTTSFSNVLECFDMQKKNKVCIKMYNNSKDMLDQGLDEIKIMKAVCSKAGGDINRLYVCKLFSYFYFK